MLRAAVALLLFLTTAEPLLAQRRGRPTRAPGRVAPIPGVGVGPPTMHTERHMGEPVKPGPIPLPSEKRKWVRLDTPHFTVFSSAGLRGTRIIAHDLERLTALLIHTSPYFRLPQSRTRIFLFGDPRDVQPYFDAARGVRLDAAGVTVRHPDGSTILIDVTAPGGAALTPRHELVHDLLRNNLRPPPLWIEEGLAEYYSNAGRVIPEHVTRVRGRMRIPLEELFALRYESPRAASWDFYAESWAAVTALVRRDPHAFNALIAELDAGSSVAEALRARYRLTPRELENLMRKAGAPANSILPSNVVLDAEPVALEYRELLFELGELLNRLPNHRDDAERHFRAARPFLDSMPIERPDVAYALFALSLRDGEREKADALFARLVQTPRATVTQQFLLDVDIDRADALAREGKLIEAAQILRELAPKMPEKARLNLEAQAAGLEAAAQR